MFTVMGFVPSVSTVMLRVDIRFRGTFDKMYVLAVFSAISHSSSTCSEVSLGMPISSKRLSPRKVEARVDANHVVTLSVTPSLDFSAALLVSPKH